MTVLAETGPHDWKNYEDYWREQDAEWLQSRSILRVDLLADLQAKITSPGVGQVAFVKTGQAAQKNTLFMYTQEGLYGSGPGWVPYPSSPKFLYASTDSATQVTFGHHTGDPANSVQAISFSPTGVDVLSTFSVKTDKFKVTATDVQIKTGTATATLTTDATGLVSNVPIKASGFTSTGVLDAQGGITTTSLTASSTITADAEIRSKTTLKADGVATVGSLVTAGTLKVGTGATYAGNANGAVIQGASAVAGKGQITVTTETLGFNAGTAANMDTQLQINGGRSVTYYNAQGGWTGHGAGVYYSATAPTNPANGTIWIQP